MKFPDKCPYCNKDIVKNKTQHIYENTNHTGLLLESHRCIHCGNKIFIVNEPIYDNCANLCGYNICFCYPITNSTVDFPQRIKTLSPNSFNAFQQTMQAKNHGLDMLVGTGLRIALEWLSWDYLIKIKNFTKEELKPLRLVDRLEKMNSSLYTDVCTKLIRKFGNDSTHIIKKLNFSVDEVINMFNILCTLIDSELNILDAHERLNSTHETNTPSTDRKS